MKALMTMVLSFFWAASCASQDIRLTREIEGAPVRAPVLIVRLPRPYSTVELWGALYLGERRPLPSGRQQQAMLDVLNRAGLESILAGEMKAALHEFRGPVQPVMEDGVEPLIVAGGDADYAAFRDRGYSHVFVLTVDRWGYYYNSYGRICYYEVDLRGELVDTGLGSVLWRRAPRAHDVTRAAPEGCDPAAAQIAGAREALARALRAQITIMARDLGAAR
jgi:hypothetical protein